LAFPFIPRWTQRTAQALSVFLPLPLTISPPSVFLNLFLSHPGKVGLHLEVQVRARRSARVPRNRDCLPLRHDVAHVDEHAVLLDVEVPAGETTRVAEPHGIPPVLEAPGRERHVSGSGGLVGVVCRGQVLLEPLDGALAGGADLCARGQREVERKRLNVGVRARIVPLGYGIRITAFPRVPVGPDWVILEIEARDP
jgi:hypothetical protein